MRRAQARNCSVAEHGHGVVSMRAGVLRLVCPPYPRGRGPMCCGDRERVRVPRMDQHESLPVINPRTHAHNSPLNCLVNGLAGRIK